MKPDHKAALEYTDGCLTNKYFLTDGVRNLAAAYLELSKAFEKPVVNCAGHATS